jgi:hypothetical protein
MIGRTRTCRVRTAASVVLVGLMVAACSKDSSRVLAENAEWSITVQGRLARSNLDLFPEEAKATFKASRNGSAYASGALYRASPHQYAFDRTFPHVEWLSGQAVRMFRLPERQVPAIRFAVRNESGRPIKWLKLYCQDLFLIFDLAGGQEVSLTGLWWGPQNVAVDGEFVDGDRFAPPSSASVEAGLVRVSVMDKGTVTVRQENQ